MAGMTRASTGRRRESWPCLGHRGGRGDRPRRRLARRPGGRHATAAALPPRRRPGSVPGDVAVPGHRPRHLAPAPRLVHRHPSPPFVGPASLRGAWCGARSSPICGHFAPPPGRRESRSASRPPIAAPARRPPRSPTGSASEATRRRSSTSARAGHSEHQLGTAIDFTIPGLARPWYYADWGRTRTGAWLRSNAWRYGFVLSYPAGGTARSCYAYEPWHYRWVGRDSRDGSAPAASSRATGCGGMPRRSFARRPRRRRHRRRHRRPLPADAHADEPMPTPTPEPIPTPMPTPTPEPIPTPMPTPESVATPGPSPGS